MSNHITLRELIDQLEDLESDIHDKLGPDTDLSVKVHFQQSYPLKGSVAQLNVLNEDGVLHVSLAVGAADGQENPYGLRDAWASYDGVPELEPEDEEDA